MKVLIVDDHIVIRRGLRAILRNTGIEVVGEASDGIEALELVPQLRPNVVLMDLNMPRLGGVEAARRLKKAHPEVCILILTGSDQQEDFFGAIMAGVDGYLLKAIGAEDLVTAIRRASRGEMPLSPSMTPLMMKEIRESAGPPGTGQDEGLGRLSHRESEILGLVGAGLTYKEIAAELLIAENTIKSHMRRILDKLGLRNRSEAVRYAHAAGMASD